MELMQMPETVPVMTLPDTVFFPQALLPLHIFEPRYRQMLRDVLNSNRLFAVAQLDLALASKPGANEPLHKTASVGIVRACQKAGNETSNLLLQGLCRVAITDIVREQPYRIIAIQPLTSTQGGDQQQIEILRDEVLRLINVRRRLGTPAPQGISRFLESIEDADTFADLAVFNLCDDGRFKQTLLETLDTRRRLELFARRLRNDIEAIRLRRKLQGRIADDDIPNN